MTQQERQQIKEFFQAKAVFDKLGIKKEDVICQDKPDMLISNFNGKCIGIEVTTCLPSKILLKGKVNRARTEDMIWKACQYYKEHKSQEISGFIFVYFTDKAYDIDYSIKQDEFNKLVTEEIDKHFQNDKYEEYAYSDNYEDVMKYLSMTQSGAFKYDVVKSIDRIECVNSFDVSVGCTYCAKAIDVTTIEHCIKNKEAKLVEYKNEMKNKMIKEYWLVINLPIQEPFFFDYVPEKSFTSTFNRIYMTQMSSIKRLK